MPTDAPELKVQATRGYGAEVVRYDRLTEDREAIARDLAQQRGLTLVPPYDDPFIMAGQGTAAGLLSGCATAAAELSPGIKIVGVETETSNDWVLSLEAGHPVKIPPPDTIADGMRTQQPGALTFPVVQSLGRGVVTVSDQQVKEAMRFLLLRMKLLVEPTGAVPFAALLSGKLEAPGQRVGIILSGGNADPRLIADLMLG
jgi:threonine dehydratase